MLDKVSEGALAVVCVAALDKMAENGPAAPGWAWLAGLAHSEAARRHGREVDARLSNPMPALTAEEREAVLAEWDAAVLIGAGRRASGRAAGDEAELRREVDDLLAHATAALTGAATTEN